MTAAGNKFENGDIKIQALELTSSNGKSKVDITNLLLTMSIFEEIDQPTVYAEIVLKDAIGLQTSFPIIGEEFIKVTFISPAHPKAATYNFRINKMDSIIVDDNVKSSTYLLKCISNEHFINSNIRIENSYKLTISEIVKNILTSEIKTKKNVVVEPTRGINEIVVPRLSPLAAIDFLRQKSISLSATGGGPYLFYENQDGFNFKSIEYILREGIAKIDSPTSGLKLRFTHGPNVAAGDRSDEARQVAEYRNIIKMERLATFDTYTKLQSGAVSSTIRTFDIFTKKTVDVQFKLSEQFQKFKTTDPDAKLPNSLEFVNQYEAGSRKFLLPKDSARPDDQLGKLVGHTNAYDALFSENVMRCLVQGDSALKVSDVIYLDMPTTSGLSGDEGKMDARFSGNYMITKLRHLIYVEDKKFRHRIAFDCNKLGLKAGNGLQ